MSSAKKKKLKKEREETLLFLRGHRPWGKVTLSEFWFSLHLFWLLSHVQLFVTSWTVAHQAPLSMGFPRQEYQSGLPFPSRGDLPSPRIEPPSPASGGRFFTTSTTWEARSHSKWSLNSLLLSLIVVMQEPRERGKEKSPYLYCGKTPLRPAASGMLRVRVWALYSEALDKNMM